MSVAIFALNILYVCCLRIKAENLTTLPKVAMFMFLKKIRKPKAFLSRCNRMLISEYIKVY